MTYVFRVQFNPVQSSALHTSCWFTWFGHNLHGEQWLSKGLLVVNRLLCTRKHDTLFNLINLFCSFCWSCCCCDYLTSHSPLVFMTLLFRWKGENINTIDQLRSLVVSFQFTYFLCYYFGINNEKGWQWNNQNYHTISIWWQETKHEYYIVCYILARLL